MSGSAAYLTAKASVLERIAAERATGGWTPADIAAARQKVPVEVISRLVGHRSTTVTETVYRKQLRPVIEGGANVMDRIFPPETGAEA
jgi:integrase